MSPRRPRYRGGAMVRPVRVRPRRAGVHRGPPGRRQAGTLPAGRRPGGVERIGARDRGAGRRQARSRYRVRSPHGQSIGSPGTGPDQERPEPPGADDGSRGPQGTRATAQDRPAGSGRPARAPAPGSRCPVGAVRRPGSADADAGRRRAELAAVHAGRGTGGAGDPEGVAALPAGVDVLRRDGEGRAGAHRGDQGRHQRHDRGPEH